jgi:light-regulated signal transduction histidine kinase (bacteriophytochrome)
MRIDDMATVLADPAQMAQVFQNLISNAIKYRSGEPLRIHIGATRHEGDWIFSVKDNGAGFDEKNAQFVFGVFKRLHGRNIPGTGIGLAICKKIVERHGGRMWAHSTPGKGSTFYFTLPVVRNGTADCST